MTPAELIAELEKIPADTQLRWHIKGHDQLRNLNSKYGGGYSDNEYRLDHWSVAGHGHEVNICLEQREKDRLAEHEPFRQL